MGEYRLRAARYRRADSRCVQRTKLAPSHCHHHVTLAPDELEVAPPLPPLVEFVSRLDAERAGSLRVSELVLAPCRRQVDDVERRERVAEAVVGANTVVGLPAARTLRKMAVVVRAGDNREAGRAHTGHLR
ncbi:hypothetical protein FVE85_5103 [Porphyridium purpureum]|uniref:Uncharacterized protein n=1 Tax=Porphyridium purpureum TaxID=35688 RepID=A0A5J4Z2M8_PORPP|nr:hypothetical protein FVE85_5103 [Porphyridium purpureum]|eukprot:POR3935..scf295_1